MGGILWNDARMKTVDMARRFFPELVKKATVKGKMEDGRIIYNDAPDGFTRMFVQRDGKTEQYDVADAFAKGFSGVIDDDVSKTMCRFVIGVFD